MATESVALGSFLREQYERIFARPWAVMPSALVLASLNVFLFGFDRPWTASDGMRNWGDSLFGSIGLLEQTDLLAPWLYSGSVLNIGLLFGALAAALLSREFAIRPAPATELVKGAIGGSLMGWGAMLAFGCNVGGFLSALSALSVSGMGMMAGLAAGSFLATRYVIRENAKLIGTGKLPFQSACDAPPPAAAASSAFGLQPIGGALVLVALLLSAYFYRRLGYGPQAAFLFFGVAFGVVFQRSRFCLVRAFREPFLSGEGEHARAAALALTLSMIGFSILKATDLKDATDWVFPSWWFGSFAGGTLFGVGMVLAGGCGAGSIWRAGEGHIKLWIAVIFFALGASLGRLILVKTELLGKLGAAVFLPNVIGWGAAIWSVIALMTFWYLLSSWNEQRKQVGALKF